jgi:hypothetical protein
MTIKDHIALAENGLAFLRAQLISATQKGDVTQVTSLTEKISESEVTLVKLKTLE